MVQTLMGAIVGLITIHHHIHDLEVWVIRCTEAMVPCMVWEVLAGRMEVMADQG